MKLNGETTFVDLTRSIQAFYTRQLFTACDVIASVGRRADAGAATVVIVVVAAADAGAEAVAVVVAADSTDVVVVADASTQPPSLFVVDENIARHVKT